MGASYLISRQAIILFEALSVSTLKTCSDDITPDEINLCKTFVLLTALQQTLKLQLPFQHLEGLPTILEMIKYPADVQSGREKTVLELRQENVVCNLQNRDIKLSTS